MNRMCDYVVVPGRYHPLHKGHIRLFEKALTYSDHLIILVGSAYSSPTTRNPFSWQFRRQMIGEALKENEIDNSRVTILPIEDFYYSDDVWVGEVKKQVHSVAKPTQSIAIAGHKKDFTSYYLDLFPGWKLFDIKAEGETVINSTDIRRDLFETGRLSDQDHRLPFSVIRLVNSWAATANYKRLEEEWKFLCEEKGSWSQAPYPPIFVTTDAVVVCSGHVLLVERGVCPGKGQYAFPGGHLNPFENIETGCLRELKEETKLDLPPAVLRGSIKEVKEFSHPLRSIRGRVITFAHLLKLKHNPLPKVKGSDDAARAFWMPLDEVHKNQENFFEDHYQILRSFLKL